MAAGRVSERGGYLTGGRALELERRLSSLEATLTERIAQQDREIAELRRTQVELIRAQTQALINVLRGETGQ